jgi:hypothetical protein
MPYPSPCDDDDNDDDDCQKGLRFDRLVPRCSAEWLERGSIGGIRVANALERWYGAWGCGGYSVGGESGTDEDEG